MLPIEEVICSIPIGRAIHLSPEDGTAPEEIGLLSYANDLNIAAIHVQVPNLASSQVIVPGQPLLKSQAIATSTYRWIMTLRFSLDASTLAYIEFTSNPYEPFTRSSKVYAIDIHSSGTQITLGSPRSLLLAGLAMPNWGLVSLGFGFF